LSAYDQALDEFLEKYTAHPDVTGIYQFGSVRNPGISDLDFIVVVRDTLTHPISQDYGYDFLSEQASYILSHNPIIVPESLVPDLWKIYPILGELKRHYGTAWTQPEPAEDTDSYIALNLMAICFRYPRLFLHLQQREFLDVRLSLQVVNALRHAFTQAGKLGIPTPDHSQQFMAQVDQLQRQWFSMAASEQFANLTQAMQSAAACSAELVQRLAAYARERIGRVIANGHAEKHTLVGRFEIGSFLFLDLPDEADLMKVMEDVRQATGMMMGTLPKEYLLPLLPFGASNSPIRPILEQHLILAGQYHADFNDSAYGAGQDIARCYGSLFEFYANNPIALPMYPDPFRFYGATLKNGRQQGWATPGRWLNDRVRTLIQTSRLRRANVRVVRLKPFCADSVLASR
jgi:hypothetical protein